MEQTKNIQNIGTFNFRRPHRCFKTALFKFGILREVCTKPLRLGVGRTVQEQAVGRRRMLLFI